jgi:iron complex outermembrane receptor protein
MRVATVLAVALAPCAAVAIEATAFADMSLEELGSIEITSVSKRPERVGDAAGSVFVITAEDIRRSGATSLPEALRQAPNLHVAQVSASGYAISARGSNGSSSSAPNKMLVLIDGRSVYSPLFSGVFWDVQDVMLEDVERIEVISGPGGTLWGINAVNGVINVITKSAEDTQGALVAAHAGNRGSGGAFRFGGEAGGGGHYRLYAKYSEHDGLSTESGLPANDAWNKSQVGFRADWDRPREQLMIQGNAYTARVGQPEPGAISVSGTDLEPGTIDASGVNLVAAWSHRLDGGSSLKLQAYYDRSDRTVPPTFSETLDIADLQFQHSLAPWGRHTLTWGASYRHSRDRVQNNSSIFAFLPEKANQNWSSLFAQDEVSLSDDLRLILGARVERNPYTGNEVLPNAKLAWKLSPDHLLWTAISRAVRGPSRLDADAYVPREEPFLLVGGPRVRSEVATVTELGYRGKPTSDLTYSVTAFHTDYDYLRTQEISASGTFLTFANEMEGDTNGIEMWGTYQMSRRWRLSAGFVAMKERLRLKPVSNDAPAPGAVGLNPSNSWQIRSGIQLAPRHTLDVALRHVGALPFPYVPAYTAFDARYGWRVLPNLELSVTAKDLFGSDRAEYGPFETRSTIPPKVFLQVQLQL